MHLLIMLPAFIVWLSCKIVWNLVVFSIALPFTLYLVCTGKYDEWSAKYSPKSPEVK